MPQVVAEVWVPVSPAEAFAVSQTTGDLRLRWDPFITAQRFLDGVTAAAKDVRTLTKARLGPSMVSRYVSYRPPTSVGMTMEEGPWFFATFGGGWRFTPETRDGTDGALASWKYTFTTKPAWLAPIADRIGEIVLHREIRTRIDAFAQACADAELVAQAAQRQ